MDHPHIARVLDAGATSSGLPFFVMELVRGIPVTDYCDRERLTIRERLTLFVDVCRAVQHAHQKGIIHRDIKPSNILVTVIDGIARPKIIDFGVAKATGPSLTERTLFTGFHQFVGTPLYMSPEQADVSGVDVDTRSDVYSLGVLLYELLTGTTPVEAENWRTKSFDEVRRMIRDHDPLRPSARISTLDNELRTTLSEKRRTSPRQFDMVIRGELDWIVMKCLEKDRGGRYESVSALAADIHRYLNQEPVEACSPSALYRFRKFARKRRAALLTLGLIATSLVVGAGMSLWQLVEANKARQRAELNLRHGNEAVEILLSRVAEEQLLDEPQMEGFRRALLTDALRINASLLTENPHDPDAQFEAGKAYRRMAHIQVNLGAPNEAAEAARQAVRIIEALVDAFPDEERYPHELAKSYYVLSIAHFDGAPGSIEESLAIHRKALTLHNKSLAASPEDPQLQQEVSNACNILGFVVQSSDPDESQALFRRSLDLGARLIKRFPERTDMVVDFARSHWFWGRTLHNTRKEYAAAKREFQGALAVLGALPEKSPRTSSFRKTRVEVLASLALACVHSAEAESAVHHAREATTLAEKLHADYPANERYRWLVVDTRDKLAYCLEQDGKLDAASQERDEIGRFVIAKIKPSSKANGFRADNYANLARIELERGHHVSAATAIGDGVKTKPFSSLAYEPYCGMALVLCAQLAERDGRLSINERSVMVERYMAMARQSINLEELAARWVKNRGDTTALLTLATLQACFGKQSEHQATCRQAIQHAKDIQDPVIADAAAKACSLRPLRDPEMCEAALLEGRKAVDLGKDHSGLPWFRLARGMAAYRAGQYDEAAESLEAAAKGKVDPMILITADCYRAMALFRLNKNAEAGQILSHAQSEFVTAGCDISHDQIIARMALTEARRFAVPDDMSTEAGTDRLSVGLAID
jgi:tetratricopeptide (TPR) repeat protein